jgi:hypothetical protein
MRLQPYLKPLLMGFLLIVIDGYICNQGVLSVLVVAWQLFVGIPKIICSSTSEMRYEKLSRLAIYLGAAIIVFSFNMLNNQIAQTRAETLITAIKAYSQKEKRYPENLTDLVPKYVSSVPRAKYSMLFNNFDYSGEYHFLYYVSFPPFLRSIYYFGSNRWSVMD